AQDLNQLWPWVALEPDVEGLPLQDRHGQKRNAARFIDVIDRDDVLVVDRRHRLRFAQKPRAGILLFRQPRMQNLQRTRPAEPLVFRQEDKAHRSSSEAAQKPILCQTTDFAWLLRRCQRGLWVRGTIATIGWPGCRRMCERRGLFNQTLNDRHLVRR